MFEKIQVLIIKGVPVGFQEPLLCLYIVKYGSLFSPILL